ncbi:cell wall-associated NlpC family hydrolase [Paenibacillus turicensis]|uniref:Cell wall-associated NlpC family hydrolase n=1 Tax=Paenibacillus turicensis TaxID=160487 RepID=A0ABS4FUZ5_9BACL|nr:SH3 domain-containing C40 family peptidase [Paenibacillus turicensis]MBP1906395.1 cell wall-associated NlpC family hydrolase [Paenibacillus turicensis]
MKRSTAIFMLSTAILSSSITFPIAASAAEMEVSTTKQTLSTGTIVGGVNLRDKPSLSGKVVGFVKKSTKVSIVEETNNYFYKIKTPDGKVGYISSNSKYVQVSGQVPAPIPTPSKPEPTQPSIPDSISSKIDLVISTGMKYLGTPYEYGSDRNTTLTFDCSDFTRQAFKEALGLALPSDSRKQGEWIKSNNSAVYSINKLKRGDLIFFMSYKGSSDAAYQGIDKNKERITHVAIYLGDGQMLHTYSTKSGGVKTDKLDGAWVKRFLYGGSVLK